MPPVVPIVAGAVATGLTAAGAVGVPFLSLTVVGSLTVGAVAGAAVGLLGAVASLLLAPTPRDRGATSSREAQQSIRESAATRTKSVGTVRKGADAHLVYDTTNLNYFVRFLALNYGPIKGITQHKLSNEDISVGTGLLVTGSNDAKWDGLVRIEAALGDPDAVALPGLVTDYGPWTADHRARGIAGVYIRQSVVAADDPRARHNHGELFYNCIMEAAADIYDPRDLSTGWSDNAALILLWYLRSPDGRNLPDAKIDFDSFSVAADTCDELVPLAAGGSEKRYRANGTFPLNEEPNAIIARMLENMDAIPFFDSQGRMGIQISTIAGTDLLAFNEDQVLSTQFRAGQRAIDRYNRVLPVITSVDHDFQELSAPAWEDAASVAADGQKTFRFDLPFCPTHTQAQRLAKKKFLRLTAEEVGTVVTDLSGFFAWQGSTITLNWSTAETDLPLRVTSRELNDDGLSVTLEVEAISDQYDVWNAEEKSLPALPAVNGSGALLAAPTGVVMSSVSIEVSPGVVQVGALVTWNSPNDAAIQAEVEISLANQDNWFGRTTLAANSAAVTISPVVDGETYDARVRFIGSAGGFTDFTLVEDVLLQVALAPIGAPALVVTPSVIDETQDSTVSGTAPNSIYLSKVQIFRSQTDNFATASLLVELMPGQGAPFSFQDTYSTAGFYYFWSRSVNVQNVVGSPSASVVLQVNNVS